MKLSFKNLFFVSCILIASNVQAQTTDTSKRNSVSDLIELENAKNLIPTTKNNPPVYVENKSETKTLVKPKKAVSKFRKKKKS